MLQKQRDLQLQYKGFLETPFLWHGKGVFDLEQFNTTSIHHSSFTQIIKQKLRLGKLVERFVSYELQQNNSVEIIAENLQILDNKITIGELDSIIVKNNIPIHLEIVYKFYLYDYSMSNIEVERWIGPNKRDSFIQKLTKLKKKQLPLLYSDQTKKYLSELNLSTENIQQQVYFKAQLFVHLNDYNNEFPFVDNNCIYGFYIYAKELEIFNHCKFYIPNKHNWLVAPYTNVDWLNFEQFSIKLNTFLNEQNAPLCWLKKKNGELVKFFVVWW